MKALLLDNLSWPEFKSYQAGIELAIVPTGSCEQHGPNLTFAADAAVAREVGKLVGEKLYPKVVVCPTIPYGISPHHMHFPGSITFRVETYLSVLTDVALSLKEHGINKVLFLNGHGGNTHSLGAVCSKLYHEHGMRCGFASAGGGALSELRPGKTLSPVLGHACEVEVSQAMHLVPQIVKTDALTPGDLVDGNYKEEGVPWAMMFMPFHEKTANGCLGDARNASADFGKELTERGVENLAAFIQNFFLR